MKKKKQNKLQNSKYKKFLLPTFIITTLLCIVLLFASVLYLFRENVARNNAQSSNDVAYFISQAIEGLTQDAPVASYTNKQFIDPAKVQFTKTENTSLVYFYSPPGTFLDSLDEEYTQQDYIQLSSRALVDSSLTRLRTSLAPFSSDTLELVPGIQNCSRLFIITFQDTFTGIYDNYKLINSKPLADGRTAYIWKAYGDLCMGANESMGEDLLAVISTIESY